MIGIDHSKANIDVRCIFSFTKKQMAEVLPKIRDQKGIHGCVMISTCNRMELWVSCEEELSFSLCELLCKLREVPFDLYGPYFTERKEKEAVAHLFSLSCGLKSRILGEDQIITQVKDSLAFAREQYVTDNVLEVLFRMAVTAAKKVKTEVTLAIANQSVIHQAIQVLRQRGYEIAGKKCMVIGNGAMGKLAASTLQQAGADVTVTVRQYRSGIVDIPRECKRIDYGNRMELFPECDMVVSATASPNYTLKRECVDRVEVAHEMILLDLAVPRDIEPSVGEVEGIQLFDIDDFHIDIQSGQLQENIEKAQKILDEQMEEFYQWYECRDVIPKIQEIREKAVEDFSWRMQKIVRELPVEENEREKLKEQMNSAAGKVIAKLLFELRGKVSQENFRESIEVLSDLYGEEKS
ncbi:MAG: glutamyl-tRNA reductase [Lachnospiraceae bacterium]|nr:glutamyl-tRNA reductase [Lachnospiraceae bacterium]